MERDEETRVATLLRGNTRTRAGEPPNSIFIQEETNVCTAQEGKGCNLPSSSGSSSGLSSTNSNLCLMHHSWAFCRLTPKVNRENLICYRVLFYILFSSLPCRVAHNVLPAPGRWCCHLGTKGHYEQQLLLLSIL